MKKQLLLIALSCVCYIQSAIAQSELWSMAPSGGANNEGTIFKMNLTGSSYTRVYDFAPTTLNASTPQYSTPVQANDGKLYSMTSRGGLYKSGNIFSYDTVTSVFTTVYSFAGGTDGSTPYGSLMKASNGILYGMTNVGGISSKGVLFSFNVSTSIYTKLIDFSGSANGANPYGSLLQASNGFLYGLTYNGGTSNSGTLFKYDISTNTLSKLVDFNGTNGSGPRASLIQALNGKLYGTTLGGGTSSVGTIFSYDIGSNILTKRFDFGNSTTGRYTYSTLVQASSGIFYGTTTVGGTNAVGVVYSFDDALPTYTVIHNFNASSSTNGSKSYSSLLLASNSKLYGLTAEGLGGSGTLFSITTGGIFSKLYTLNYTTDGANPFGSLMQTTTGKLYGMTSNGGGGSYGTFFSYNYNTSSFINLQDFRVLPSGGAPAASLFKASNGLLYGMTEIGGGSTSGGSFFSFNPQTNAVVKLQEFSNGLPTGSVIQATNGKLYGLTHGGGTSGQGTLFSYDISTSTFATVFNFTGSATGRIPQGSLIQATNGKLYGMTSYGGVSDNGVIFSYDITANTYTKHIDFDGTTNGKRPYGSLVQTSNGKMYGMTFLGGVADNGVLFSFNTTGNSYSKILEFSGVANGFQPFGSLIQANDGKLYGLTGQGGNNSGGVIFSLDTVSNTFIKLYNFTSPLANTQGCNPYGTLYKASNGKLYGMTYTGGVNGVGVIFNYDISSNTYSKIRDLNYPDGTNHLYNSFIEIDNIITNSAGLNLCANSAVSIPYSIYGTFNAGNVFTAQLSDSSGSFASPVNIGTLTSTTAGTISSTISNSTVAGTSYRIRINSSNPVATGSDNGSNIKISTYAPVTINIIANPGNTNCSGTAVTFTATSTNGGNAPFYDWKKNGVTVLTGANTYPTSTLNNNDTITCTVTSNATCISGNSTVTSNQIIMAVTPLVTPSVSIVSNHSGTICSGIDVTFTATPVNGGTPTYQWKKNGVNVGSNNEAYTASGFANGDVITCVMTSSITCVTTSIATSNSITLTVGSCTLSTAAVPTNICSNSNFNVSFTASPTSFNAGNVFTAQLSNASGSFASPVTIGSLISSTAAPIPVVIPMGTANGTSYRIRVIASNPSTTGTDNGTNISISKFNSIVFIESMGSVAATTAISAHETANGFDNDGFTMSGTGDIRNTTPSSGYTGASGGANVLLNNTSAGLNFQIATINSSALVNPQLSFGVYKFTNSADGSTLVVEVSSNGSTYTPLSFTLLPTGTGTATWYARTATGSIPSTANLRIRFTNSTTATQFRIDDIKLVSENLTAGITASGSTILCPGDSVSLNASSAGSYLWSNSATTSSIVIGSFGNNYCDLTAINSCVLRSNTIVTTNGIPTRFNVTGGGNYCSSPGTGVTVGVDSSQSGVTYKLLKMPSTYVGATLNGTGNPISFGIITGAGTYKVVATRTIGACSDTMTGSAVITITAATTYYLDNDQDGYGNSNNNIQACTQPLNYVTLINDCMDNDSTIYPGATEIVGDGVDQNCDNKELCYTDVDDDNFGTNVTILSANLVCTDLNEASINGDCNDNNATIKPGATEIAADGIDQNCDNQELCYTDIDDDNFGTNVTIISTNLVCTDLNEAPVNGDCNDNNANIKPGATEICCNGVDDNCDGSIDNGCPLNTGVYCIGPSVSYSPPTGSYLNANNPYPTLSAAVSALNSFGACGHVVFEFQNNYTSGSETFPITITYQGIASATASFRPRSDVPTVLNIIGSVDTTARALIKFMGADYVSFDGSPGGVMGNTKNILVRNTNSSSIIGSTFYFANDATHNTLNALKCEDGNGSYNVFIGGTTGTTGNDFITIQNCELLNRTDVLSYPAKQIYALGTSTGNAANSNVIVNGNNISNATIGIHVHGGNNGTWTISNNHIYSNVNSVNSLTYGIQFAISSDTCTSLITGNYIGGTAPFAGGVPMIPYFGHSIFNGIYSYCLASTSLSTISNNVIANISVPNSFFKDVYALHVGGPTNVMNNTIGDANTTNSINFGVSSTVNFVGIDYSSSSILPVSISNNMMQNITFQNPAAGGAGNFNGINYENTATHVCTLNGNMFKNINSNSRGSLIMINVTSTTANGAATHITNNKIETIVHTNLAGNGGFQGIYCNQSNATISGNRIGKYNVGNDIVNASAASSFGILLSNNKLDSIAFDTIANITLTNTANNVAFRGISQSAGSNSTSRILNNVISEINVASSKSNIETDDIITYTLCGIMIGAPDSTQQIKNNIVKGLRLTNTTAVNPAVVGIGGFSNSKTTISENFIYDLTNAATNITTFPLIFGIKMNLTVVCNVNNNMIALSNSGNTNPVRMYGIYDNSTNNLKSYNYNSIALTGSAFGNAHSAAFWRNASTSSLVNLRNNIFYNSRSGGTGKHYAIVNETGSATNWTPTASNYNNLYTSDTTTLGKWGATDKTFTTWKNISGGDANSKNANVNFVNNNSDLHLLGTGNCALSGTGTNVSGITTDYDSDTRNFPTPDIGADEFNEIPSVLNITLLIEGFYAGGNSLTPALFNAGVSLDPSDCDSITIELRTTVSPYNLFYSTTALLKTDGSIACAIPCGAVSNSYYLAIKTRNGIETWSKLPVAFSGSTYYNFKN